MINNTTLDINIKIINSRKEHKQVLLIRKKVFVEEQSVPIDIEIDEYEESATHVIAYNKNKPVGTARYRITKSGTKLERFAVIENFRGFGIGAKILQFILNQIDHTEPIYLNAQENVIGFYEKHGFYCVGKRFFEANISHRKMIFHRR